MPFGITVIRSLVDVEDVRDVAAHVVRAHDQRVRPVRHPALDRVDVRLRLVLHPALVAPVLGRVDGRHIRHAQPVGERRGGAAPRASRGRGQVVGVLLGERLARPRACPRSSAPPTRRSGRARAASSARGTRWTRHPAARCPGRGALSAGGRSRRRASARPPPTPCRTSASGELAHVPGEPPLDHRRVLPGEDAARGGP